MIQILSVGITFQYKPNITMGIKIKYFFEKNIILQSGCHFPKLVIGGFSLLKFIFVVFSIESDR